MALYHALRPLLFRLDAEAAHGAGMAAAGIGETLSPAVRAALARGCRHETLGQTLFAHDGADGRPARPGLYVPNPVGLAAGFDKNAERVPLWAAVGFGFAEVGSVTARARLGNPKPRAFRLPDDRALINRMGLNNEGAEAVGRRLAALRAAGLPDGFVLGVNVAKTHDPAILGDAALDDFATTVRHVAAHADYLALNVSCPNTAEGKTFEEPAALDALLARVRRELAALGGHAATVPLLVKLSPPAPRHFDAARLAESVAACRPHGVDGFIAANTAPDRAGLRTDAGTLEAMGAGGLSGRPAPGALHGARPPPVPPHRRRAARHRRRRGGFVEGGVRQDPGRRVARRAVHGARLRRPRPRRAHRARALEAAPARRLRLSRRGGRGGRVSRVMPNPVALSRYEKFSSRMDGWRGGRMDGNTSCFSFCPSFQPSIYSLTKRSDLVQTGRPPPVRG